VQFVETIQDFAIHKLIKTVIIFFNSALLQNKQKKLICDDRCSSLYCLSELNGNQDIYLTFEEEEFIAPSKMMIVLSNYFS